MYVLCGYWDRDQNDKEKIQKININVLVVLVRIFKKFITPEKKKGEKTIQKYLKIAKISLVRI